MSGEYSLYFLLGGGLIGLLFFLLAVSKLVTALHLEGKIWNRIGEEVSSAVSGGQMLDLNTLSKKYTVPMGILKDVLNWAIDTGKCGTAHISGDKLVPGKSGSKKAAKAIGKQKGRLRKDLEDIVDEFLNSP